MGNSKRKSAKKLQKYLRDYFEARDFPLKNEVDNWGIHWSVILEKNQMKVKVSCYDDGVFSAKFYENDAYIGISRVLDKKIAKLAGMIFFWLSGNSIETMEKQFREFDEERRRTESLVKQVASLCKEVGQQNLSKVHHVAEDIFEIEYKKNDRSLVAEVGDDGIYFELFWDECFLAKHQFVDVENFVEILRSWVLNSEMPSKIKQKFDGLNMIDLADYFESENSIDRRFMYSWKGMETDIHGEQRSLEELSLIHKMIEKGYNRKTRAGGSILAPLILSRSKNHGMKENSDHIMFWFRKSKMTVFYMRGNIEIKKLEFDKVEFSSELKSLLDELVSVPVS